jgi:hypothetical protein
VPEDLFTQLGEKNLYKLSACYATAKIAGLALLLNLRLSLLSEDHNK